MNVRPSLIRRRLPVPEGSRWERYEPEPGLCPAGCVEVWLSKVYLVQVYDQPGKWRVLGIRRVNGNEIREGWNELQRIKDEVVGEHARALEHYPRASDLVDSAPMRWLWIVPEDVDLGRCMF